MNDLHQALKVALSVKTYLVNSSDVSVNSNELKEQYENISKQIKGIIDIK